LQCVAVCCSVSVMPICVCFGMRAVRVGFMCVRHDMCALWHVCVL